MEDFHMKWQHVLLLDMLSILQRQLPHLVCTRYEGKAHRRHCTQGQAQTARCSIGTIPLNVQGQRSSIGSQGGRIPLKYLFEADLSPSPLAGKVLFTLD